MPFFENKGNIYLFLHIPKTGGTSIEAHLQKFCRMFFYSNNRPLPAITRVSPQHYPISTLRSIFGNNFWQHGFTIVRNPFHRIASEYNYQKRYFWPQIPPFDIWIDRVLGAAMDNPFYLDNHLRPQVNLIDNTLLIFKYEDGLDRIILKIEELIGIKSSIPLPSKLRSDYPPVIFSKKSTELILNFYKNDFELLNYAMIPPKN